MFVGSLGIAVVPATYGGKLGGKIIENNYR
jgi:hypothetical protein